MPTKREIVLDAAIEVLGTRGSKGLTHRGVDDVAGVPTGTSSNYFRTREALLVGVVDRLVERDKLDWERLSRLPKPQSIGELIDATTAWALHSIDADRVRTTARYTLMLESATTESMQAPFRTARRTLVEWVEGLLGEVSDDPAAHALILMDYLEGAILHQLTMPAPDFDPRPLISDLATSLLTKSR